MTLVCQAGFNGIDFPVASVSPESSFLVGCCLSILRHVVDILADSQFCTVEALNIASACKPDVDTASVAPPAGCGPLSSRNKVEAKRVTRLPRLNIWQVQHCIRGGGAADVMSQCFF